MNQREKENPKIVSIQGHTMDRVMSLCTVGGISLFVGFGSLTLPLANTVKLATVAAGFGVGAMALTGAVAVSLIGKRDEQIERLAQQLEKLRTEVEAWRNASTIHSKKSEDLEKRIRVYELNQDDAAMRIPEVKDRFESLKDKLATVTDAEAEATAMVEEYEEKLSHLEAKLEAIEQRALTAEQTASAKTAELDKLQREHDRLKLEFDSHRQHFSEKLELELTRQTQTRINDAVLTQTLELREQLDEKNTELAEAEQDVEDLLTALQQHEPEMTRLKLEAQQLLKEKAEVIQNLDAQIRFLEAPRRSTGKTLVDQIANHVLDYFAEQGYILDFHHSELNPSGGYTIFWDLKRNPPQIDLSEQVFDRHLTTQALMGLSERKLDFQIDPRNGLLTLQVHLHKGLLPSNQDEVKLQAMAATVGITSTASAPRPRSQEEQKWDAQLKQAGCFLASEFDLMVDELIADRVRICSGSEGGKTPVMEQFAIAITNKYQGRLVMLNPLPGSPKDYLAVPSVPTTGDPFASCLGSLDNLHRELSNRRENLQAAQSDKFVMVAADELPKMARKAGELEQPLGLWLKDFYQLSSHANMGIVTSAQGVLVSGVKGGKGDVTQTLRTEDFDNSAQVFLGDAARTAITSMKGSQRSEYLEHFEKLQTLCDKANASLSRRTVPKRGDKQKRVDPNAYRVAFCIPTGGCKPFFFQIPEYGSLRLSSQCEVPTGAKITSPHRDSNGNLKSDRPSMICPSCGGADIGANSPTAKRQYRWCQNQKCEIQGKKKSPAFFQQMSEAVAK